MGAFVIDAEVCKVIEQAIDAARNSDNVADDLAVAVWAVRAGQRFDAQFRADVVRILNSEPPVGTLRTEIDQAVSDYGMRLVVAALTPGEVDQ